MRFKGTVWMAALFLGIALYYFFIDVPREQKQAEEKERSEKILLFEKEDVEEFSLEKKDSVIRLATKDGKVWNLTEPVSAEADDIFAESYLTRLNDARFLRVVEETPSDLSVYGLKEPKLTVRLKIKGQEEKSLLLGDDHPMRGKLYVKLGDEDRALLAELARIDLEPPVYDFRDKTLMDFETDAVTKIKIVREQDSLDLVKDGEDWRIIQNMKAKGDANVISNFLNRVRLARVKEFAAEAPESLEPFGLQSPKIHLALELTNGEKPSALLIGAAKEGEGVYGKLADAQNVVVFDNALLGTLSKKMEEFLDKTLLDFEEKEVARIEFNGPDETVSIRRDPEDLLKWTLESPVKTGADTATLNSLLFDLKAARVQEFIQFSLKDPAAFGLEAPQREMVVHLGENKPWKLQLGNQTAGKEYYFAKRTGENSVFTLSAETVGKVFRSLHDLRDKKLLHFKSEHVHRVRIDYPGKTFELARDGEAWSLVQPEAAAIKGFLGKDILWTLSNLEFDSLLDPAPEEGITGLSEPALKVTLLGEKNKDLGQVIVGKPLEDGNGHFAKIEGKNVLFSIKSRFLEEIPNDLKQFKN